MLSSAPPPFAGSSKQRPSRVQSLVSSQGSMDSDHLGEFGADSSSVQPGSGTEVVAEGMGLCVWAGLSPEDRAWEWL